MSALRATWQHARRAVPERRSWASFTSRARETLILAAICGAVTGFVVLAFERGTAYAAEWVDAAPIGVIACAPLVGLVLAWCALRYIGGRATPDTADEYLQSFHDPSRALGVRAFCGRMVGAFTTLASGCPVGFEGPAIYAGAFVGDQLGTRARWGLTRERRRVLLVAGAAAGVAAIFRAPATGAVFALEVPYQDDLARRMLLPSLVGSAAGYLTFVSFEGTNPLLTVSGDPRFTLKDIVAALVLGLGAGLCARAFSALIRNAKRFRRRVNPILGIALSGASIAAFVVIGQVMTGEVLVTGVGYRTIEWALNPDVAIPVVLGILLLRCLGVAATLAGGGVAGLFIPLVVAGALLGRVVGGALGELETSLFVVIGVAAFLGAGYRVPLAAVMFVAEATGRPGFVVPGLIAAVAAELVMGRTSVTAYQRPPPSTPDPVQVPGDESAPVGSPTNE